MRPLTPERWADLEELFGKRGAYAGCWCMYWRLARARFQTQAGEGNRRALRGLVDAGEVPGLLGVRDGRPVAWVSIAPRERYPSLERSPVLRRLDDEPVWSLVCLFIARGHRRHGLAIEVVRGALAYAREQGGRVVEACPSVPRGRELAPVSSYMGVPSLFAAAGFVECARPSEAKMVMRRRLVEA
jgi:predicted GNAT family acetyltransferase